jgi:TPR repeat protein
MKWRRLAIVLAVFWATLPVSAATSSEQKKVAKSKSSAKVKAANQKGAAKAKAGNKLTPTPATGQIRSAVVSRLGSLRTENELRKEIVAARATLARDPKNVEAKEILARAAIITSDWLLGAEAIGATVKAERLGASLKRDFSESGWRIQNSAQQGDAKARQALGVLYGRGIVLERDAKKSCAEFKAAADQLSGAGWHWAQCLLETSPDEAWVQMERAALGGHAAAQEWIGRRCLGEFGASGKDFTCAREWLSQSASLGRPRAQALFAYLVGSGQGGPVDSARAIRLYRLAAESGDADAQNNLGEIFESGRGIEKNIDEAQRWYEKAAERGLPAGHFNAGRVWAAGPVARRDPTKARAHLVQAEKAGVVQARQVLDWLDQQYPPESKPTADATSPVTAAKDAKPN